MKSFIDSQFVYIMLLTVNELPLPEHNVPFTYFCFQPDDSLMERQKHVVGK